MSGANKPRDLGQELDDIKAQLRRLMTGALSRPPLRVAEGDFMVSGGGSVTVADGGRVITYNATNGSRTEIGEGLFKFWDDFNTNPTGFGKIYCDPGAGINYLRMFPPHTGGTGSETSFTMQGRTTGEPGNAWLYTDGQALISAGSLFLDADSMQVLTGGDLQVYELPTTGSAANLRLDPGTAKIQYVTSSERYKTDLAPVEIDNDDLLSLSGITWVHVETMDTADKGPIARNVGWSAEEMDARPSLRQFVNYDDQGRPDSVEDSRVSVALLEVAKAQQAQIAALAARLETLEARP